MWKLLNQWLDKLIFFSFDRVGFWRHKLFFTPLPAAEKKKRVCWLSGATSGLGNALAKKLSSEGWRLILPIRDTKRGADLLKEVGANATLEHLDLSSSKEVAHYLPHTPIDVLIHNAGGMPNTLTKNPFGEEEIFASQVIAPFILTKRWIEQGYLKKGGRVIFVSSGGMYMQKLSLEDIDFQKHPYNKYIAYANAKRAQVILAELFAQKYRDYHFASMHPGWVKTPGVYRSMRWFYFLLYPLLRTPEEGADTIHFLTTTPKWEQEGAFWFDRSPASAHLSKTTESSEEEKKALWDLCEQRKSKWESHF